MLARHFAALFALTFSIGFIVPAFAQDEALDALPEEGEQAADPAPQAEEKRSAPKLDEIIVTAQKRAEDVQDVPLSVTAIGGETLKEKNIGDLAAVGEYTPNMNIINTPTFNFIYMRGIGSGWNRGFEQSVAIVIDEVFYGRPSYLSNGQLDLASIEVLRGPQGTLFGKNAVAGALHIRTARPEAEWSADGDATFGTDNFQRYRGAIGGPLFNDDTSFRFAFLKETRDGDIQNTLLGVDENQIDNLVARLKFGWEPSANLRFMAS
ncbi:MAG: TonB-dependent receptor, partial [Alphaproteobacteria bacterium]